MKRRVIHEQQLVNTETGEITVVESSSLRGNDESFIMCRTTDGLAHLSSLTGVEIILLLMLAHSKNLKDNLVIMPKPVLKMACDELDMSYGTAERSLINLRKKNLLKKPIHSVYIVNPMTFYSGGSNKWKTAYQEYVSAIDVTYSSPTHPCNNEDTHPPNAEAW